MKLQAQAVLQRADLMAPLRLAGVLPAGSFYPLTPQDAWGPLHLEVGLVALAPLTPVVAPDPAEAARHAMGEARRQWIIPTAGKVELLSWRPIGQVRDGEGEDDVGLLITQMTLANEERTDATPSTPPYHRAARELERLAGLVYEASSAAERVAESDAALRKGSIPHAGTKDTA